MHTFVWNLLRVLFLVGAKLHSLCMNPGDQVSINVDHSHEPRRRRSHHVYLRWSACKLLVLVSLSIKKTEEKGDDAWKRRGEDQDAPPQGPQMRRGSKAGRGSEGFPIRPLRSLALLPPVSLHRDLPQKDLDQVAPCVGIFGDVFEISGGELDRFEKTGAHLGV